jgi:hypothetical protein
MTYQIATIISCVLFPIVGWLALSLAKRTIYRPITSDEGQVRDEQAARDEVRASREKGVRKIFTYYAVFVSILFLLAALSGPAKKVQAALWPTATPTVTNTRTPTITPTRTNTPRASNTPKENNFLTTISGTGTITGTVLPSTLVPSGGGGSVVIVQTRIVVQTRIAPVTQIVYYPVTVIVTITNTPLPSSETATITPTYTATQTATPTITFTPTETETPTP